MIGVLIFMFFCSYIFSWLLFKKYTYYKENGEWQESVMGKYMPLLLATLMLWGEFIYFLIKFIIEK